MKKIGLVVGLVLLLLFTAGAFAAITEEKAMEAAYQNIAYCLKMQKDAISLTDSSQKNGTWQFVFTVNAPGITDGRIEITLDAKGNMTALRGPEWREDVTRLVNSTKRLAYTMEDMVAYREAWLPYLQEFEALLADQKGTSPNVFYQFAYAFGQDIRLPEEDSVLLDTALNTATQSILSLPGWTKEHLDFFDLSTQVYYISSQLGQPVYQFIFSRRSSAAPQYINFAWDVYEKQYLKPLYARFGGSEDSTPQYISVRVDAKTGSVLEEPNVQFPGADYVDEFWMIQ